MAQAATDPHLTLYSSSVSDCSARLRIALNLKKLPYRLMPISMAHGEHEDVAYKAINPARTVPTLVFTSGRESLTLTQSIATLEFLEEAFPIAPRLLPAPDQVVLRARVRTLVGIIATDIHPHTTPRVGPTIESLYPSPAVEMARRSGMVEWRKVWITRGLEVYEATVKETCGRYSVGDKITLADVVLIPELWTSIRFGVDLAQYSTILQIFLNLSQVYGIQEEHSRPENSLETSDG